MFFLEPLVVLGLGLGKSGGPECLDLLPSHRDLGGGFVFGVTSAARGPGYRFFRARFAHLRTLGPPAFKLRDAAPEFRQLVGHGEPLLDLPVEQLRERVNDLPGG